MIWINDISAALALSQLVMLALYFLLNYRGSLAKWISLFCLCLGAYVATTLSIVGPNTLPSFLLFRLATLAPFLLWIIARLLFVDSAHIPGLAWAGMAFFILARGIGSGIGLVYPEAIASGLAFVVVQLIPQLLMLGFTLHAIYLAFYGYSSDLVEQRRKFRVVFITCSGLLIATIVGFGIVEYFSDRSFPTAIYSLYIFLAALAFNITSLRLTNDAVSLVPDQVVRPRDEESANAAPPIIDPATVQRIRKLMEDERIYTQPGLTISDLAEALSVQEYRLRRIINQTMKHRNFNQFLNSYRIEDASQRLLTTRTPISSIALDVGYSSLSVFNKAFRDRFDMTPSEYRTRQSGMAADNPNS